MTGVAVATVPTDDRAYLYGDGLFETLVWHGDKLLWENLHLDRLREGMQRLALTAPLETLREELRAAVARAPGTRGILRLTLSRGSGPRGYTPPAEASPRWRIDYGTSTADPLEAQPALRVGLAAIRLADQPALAGIKHCNRLEQVLAADEARREGLDDVLMLTPEGKLHSSSRGNLFVFRGGQLLTAPCARQGIAGTRRRLILETLAPALGFEVREALLNPGDLVSAGGAFLCNSVMGIRELASFSGQALRRDPRCGALQVAYRELGLACAA